MLEYCPYCFEKLAPSMNGPQLDLVCQQNWGTKKNHTMNIPFSEWKNWKRQGRLPICRGRGCAGCEQCPGIALSHYACPFCHTIIRDRLINNQNFQIAIIGTRNSGKTVYITMLMDTLQKNMGSVYNSPFLPIEAAEGQEIRRIIENMKLGKVPGNTTMDDVRPRLYQYGAGNKVNVMTVFDGAGEKFNDETLEAALLRYVNYASGMILLFDPTAIPAVRDDLMASHVSSSEMTTATMQDVLQGVQLTYDNYNRWHGGGLGRLFGKKKLSIPVAVVFSKFDLVFPYFNSGDAVVSKSPNLDSHVRRFNEADSQRVDKEIRAWLARVGDDGLTKTIDNCFSNVRFFGVSSLGASPANGATYVPHRVADPMLWLMNQKKMID